MTFAFHKGYLAQIRDCTPSSRNGLAHANVKRDAALGEEIQQAQHMLEAKTFAGQQPLVLSDCRIKLSKDNTRENIRRNYG